jgi:hypothetical protein
MSAAQPRCCVYTVLTGSYESLAAADVAPASSWDFICLTDNPDLRSDSWEVRHVQLPFTHDQARNSRIPKACPHRFLGDYDVSLYIDNAVRLTRPPEEFAASYLDDQEWDWLAVAHSFRSSLLDEFNRVLQLGLDEPTRIIEQFNVYKAAMPEILRAAPLWGGFILRRHMRPGTMAAGEHWLAHVLRYSRRDQLSILPALRANAIRLRTIQLDNRASEFHAWNNKHPSRNTASRREGWKRMLPGWALASYKINRTYRRLFKTSLRLDAGK